MKQLFLLCLCSFSISAAAQEFEISGTLIDGESKVPLESATVFVERIEDSTLVAYTISDQEGHFMIEGSSDFGELRLISSYAGYVPLKKIVKMDEPEIDLGLLQMEVATNELGEVMVIATRAPITVKSDTLEFNADSFTTRPDANLEDVLKKIPGMEVDTDGNITINGTPVSRILVNGEEFFGDDPKIATKNLPKEIIDKIQVVNTKTKSEEFTGKAGDPDNKTINITLDEDKNHGYFARATAGGGTNERYELSGIGNYFKDKFRLSVLASSNNINSAGFSINEVMDMMGGRARRIRVNSNGAFSINGNNFGNLGGGITKSEMAGLNFTNEWEEKYEVNGNYFFGKSDTETRNVTERQTFLPEGTYFSNSVSSGNVVNDSHRASATFEVEFDTLTKLSVSPSLRIDDGFSTQSGFEETLDEDRTLVNSSSTSTNGELYSTNFSNQINFIRRFGSRGAYIQATFRNNNDIRENENFFMSNRLIYEDGEIAEAQERNQYIDEKNSEDEYNFEISQRSVLMDDFFLDLSYDFNTSNSENERLVYDYNDIANSYSILNEELSNAFEVSSVEHIPNAGLNYEGEKLRASFNIGIMNTTLETNNFFSEVAFENTYNNLYLNSYLRYELKKGSNLYFGYSNNSNIPSITQLQPVPDVSNPLNIIIGNPELEPTFSQNFRLRYQNYDFPTRTGIFAHANLSFNENEVVPYTIVGEDLTRTTTFRNVDGGVNASLGSSYRKTIKKEGTEYRYSLGMWSNYEKEIGFTNGQLYNAHSFRFYPRTSVGFNYNDLVEIELEYNLTYGLTNYNISNDRETEYLNHRIGLEAITFWPTNWVFENDISYNYYGDVASGFDNTSLLWNMSLGYKFFDDDATLKLRVFDLLNENVSTSRIVEQDYIQNSRSLILEQYFILSFTYKISKFGGKDPNEGENGIIRL